MTKTTGVKLAKPVKSWGIKDKYTGQILADAWEEKESAQECLCSFQVIIRVEIREVQND